MYVVTVTVYEPNGEEVQTGIVGPFETEEQAEQHACFMAETSWLQKGISYCTEEMISPMQHVKGALTFYADRRKASDDSPLKRVPDVW